MSFPSEHCRIDFAFACAVGLLAIDLDVQPCVVARIIIQCSIGYVALKFLFGLSHASHVYKYKTIVKQMLKPSGILVYHATVQFPIASTYFSLVGFYIIHCH